MKTTAASPQGVPDDDDTWLRDDGAPHSREDRIAEVITLIALLFSLCIGLVIALLPVSAKAVGVRTATPSSRFSVVETVPPTSWPVRRQARVPAPQAASSSDDSEALALL